MASMGPDLVLITSDHASEVEQQACHIFAKRVEDRTDCWVTVAAASEYTSSRERGFTIIVGTVDGHPFMGEALSASGLEPVCESEGYLLHIGSRSAIVCGADSRGVLYGLGKLLRLADYSDVMTVPTGTTSSLPVGSERGVYFATHYNNWYEGAPVEEVVRYVEDLALWGVNTLWTWFDMNWYPADFDTDPESRGMRMISRIRSIYEKAHDLGMTVGLTGLANEGFAHQPPAEMRVDPSAKRGGFYPFSQICPSSPGGMEMILADRRKVLELVGPIDAFWYWPYDQGGCGCKDCADENGWGAKFMEIGPQVADLVRDLNPDANFIVSTWLMNDAELALVYEQARKTDRWFDGLLVETYRAGQPDVAPDCTLSVFPEISMFETFFVSYGCNAAMPLPRKFAEEAKAVAKLGYGSVVYSEGCYEDVSKVIWATVMWDPERTPEDVVAEYSRYYFGSRNAETGANLILDLENTWGVYKLAQTSPQTASRLLDQAASMEPRLPKADWCRHRWELLLHRAKLDYLMVKVGPGRELMKEIKDLFDEAGYSDDLPALRSSVESAAAHMRDRVRGMDDLFAAYADYLHRFHLDQVMLVFTPDQVLGSVDYSRLLTAFESALGVSDDEMRRAVVLAVHRWFWANGVGVDFLFL